MAFRLCQFSTKVPVRLGQTFLVRNASSTVTPEQLLYHPTVGNREIVGYGRNGLPQYLDDTMYPYPSIRFKESTAEAMALQEKATGDWKKLSPEEIKTIYRNNFCQTFSEMKTGTGRWKQSLSWMFFIMGSTCFTFLFIRQFYPELPRTFDDDWKDASLYRQLYQRFNPVTGISSKFDYENKRWK